MSLNILICNNMCDCCKKNIKKNILAMCVSASITIIILNKLFK